MMTFNKELLLTIFGQIVPMIGAVVILKQMAIYLNPADYGNYALITSMVALLMIFPFGSLLQGISRYVPIYNKRGQLSLYIAKTFYQYSSIIFFSALIALIIYIFFIDIEPSLFLTVTLFTITTIMKSFFLTINNSKRDRKSILFANIYEFGIKIFLLYMLYKLDLLEIKTVLQIFILSEIVSIVILYFVGLKTLPLKFEITKKDKIIFLKILHFSMPILFLSLMGWLRDMSGRWYINHFMGVEQVGIFSMLVAITMIIPAGLQGVLGAYILPIIYERNETSVHYTRNILLKIIPAYLLFILIGFVILYMFHYQIIYIVSDVKYAGFSWMLPWLFLAYGIYSASIFATYEIYACKQTKKLFLPFILTASFSLIMGYTFIFNFGINGALYNFIGTYTIFSIATFVVAIRFNLSKQHKVGVV